MNLNISGHEVFLTDEIKDYATDKMEKLCSHYKSIIQLDLIMEENHNKDEATACHTRGNITKPGLNISAEGEGRTIYSAIDDLEKKLRRQLERDKNTRYANENSRLAKSKRIIRRLFGQE